MDEGWGDGIQVNGHELITALAKMTKEELDMAVLAPVGEAWDVAEIRWAGAGLIDYSERGVVLWPGERPEKFMTLDEERAWRATEDDEDV